MKIELANGVSLTEFRPSDEDALVEWLSEREIYNRTLRIPSPYTLADAQKWLATVAELTRQNGQPLQWAIRDETGKLIGAVGLDAGGLIVGQTHKAEIGYWLGKPHWGRGIMTAAVGAVCRHAFEQIGLAKITACVFSFNDASCRVLEKCGFEQEGYLRKHHAKDGRFIDAKAYGLIR